jgi:citrate lyase subunit beta/citryl-CoA lyase
MIPKISSSDDIAFVDKLLTGIEYQCGITERIGLEGQIETAGSFLAIREIAASSPRLETLCFGSGDYAESMQMPSLNIGELDRHDVDYPGDRFHAVMHAIVASARTNGLRCLDGPYAGHRDSEGFERACRISHAMGFNGKQCIHPNQVSIANRMFTPSDEELAYAKLIVQTLENSRGVASLNGKMIDAVSLRMAHGILQRHRLTVLRENND